MAEWSEQETFGDEWEVELSTGDDALVGVDVYITGTIDDSYGKDFYYEIDGFSIYLLAMNGIKLETPIDLKTNDVIPDKDYKQIENAVWEFAQEMKKEHEEEVCSRMFTYYC